MPTTTSRLNNKNTATLSQKHTLFLLNTVANALPSAPAWQCCIYSETIPAWG